MFYSTSEIRLSTPSLVPAGPSIRLLKDRCADGALKPVSQKVVGETLPEILKCSESDKKKKKKLLLLN